MDINSLLGNLSDDDISKLKKTAEQFFGNGDASSAGGADEKLPTNALFDKDFIAMASKISSMSNTNDERSNFLAALKPLLSEGRQKKADEAANMLRLMKIVNAVKENGL